MAAPQSGELVVLSGPCRGRRYSIDQDSIRIGRDRICEIQLDDEAASRVHSEVVRQDEKLFLRDLKSTNGTFHNDARIVEAALRNGDRIGIGDSVFLVRLPTVVDKDAPNIIFSAEIETPSTGVSLDLGDTRFLEMTEGASLADAHRRFTVLYDFMFSIAGTIHEPALLERALEQFLEVFPADRGLILLVSSEGAPGLQATKVREGSGSSQNIAISRTMLQQLLQKKESFLSINACTDERLADAESLAGMKACSIMGAPLKVRDKVSGIIYLDTVDVARNFSSDDLRLCTAMALQLAVCLENARLCTELLNAAEFNNAVLRALASGIMVVDMNRRIQQLNRAGQDALERNESKLLGHLISEFPELEEFNQAIQKTIQLGKPEDRYEVKYNMSSGPTILGLSTSLLMDPGGSPTGVVVNFRNLSGMRKLEEQARRAHFLEALGQLAAGVAHEIRNPLNSIRGFTQLVDENPQTPPVAKEYTKIVLEEVDRMNRIVQDMLDFSRQRQLTLLPLSLLKLMEDIVRDMQVDARDAKVVLEILQPGENLPNVLGNRDKLRQVFRNIVLNAIQACKAGGSVTVGFQPWFAHVVDPKLKNLDKAIPQREVVVHINDTGCGMTPEVMRKMFDPFFTQKETGTGLGLAITQKIIEQHHGRIEVKSEVGKGSTFSVHFPVIRTGD